MSTYYDWSPFFNAVNNSISDWGQRSQYNAILNQVAGANPDVQNAANAASQFGDAAKQRMTAGQTYANPQIGNMLPLLRAAGPQVGLPLLLNLATRQHKYSQTPQYDQNGNAFVLDDEGNQKYLDGVKARDKVEFQNGMAVDPYHTPVGTVLPKQEATPDIVQIAKTLFPNDPAKQNAYIVKNSPANLRAITNINMENRRAAGAFNDDEAALMGALAERGVSLPVGLRSRDQQKALYQGILARNPGKSPDEIADLIKKGQIEIGAQKKETQTAAAVAGRVEVAQNEIEEFVPLVRDAALRVPRSNFVPLNRLLQTADSSISDPNLKVLKGRINALLNAYDMLAARGGTDMEKRKEVRALLTSADGPEALEAQLNSFMQEAAAAHRAAVRATKVPELEASPSPAAPAPAGNGGWSIKPKGQ